MNEQKSKVVRRAKRHARVRRRVTGSPARPRLSVYRSLKNIYAQVIDDEAGRTLAAASSRTGPGAEAAKGQQVTVHYTGWLAAVGEVLAAAAKAAGVAKVCFDRGPYLYHGRVKALADGARKGGLEF